MSTPSAVSRVLILVEQEYEDLELWYPKIRLIEEGMQVGHLLQYSLGEGVVEAHEGHASLRL